MFQLLRLLNVTSLVLTASKSATADILIRTYRVYYLVKGLGCFGDPYPFHCNYLSGPVRVGVGAPGRIYGARVSRVFPFLFRMALSFHV